MKLVFSNKIANKRPRILKKIKQTNSGGDLTAVSISNKTIEHESSRAAVLLQKPFAVLKTIKQLYNLVGII